MYGTVYLYYRHGVHVELLLKSQPAKPKSSPRARRPLSFRRYLAKNGQEAYRSLIPLGVL